MDLKDPCSRIQAQWKTALGEGQPIRLLAGQVGFASEIIFHIFILSYLSYFFYFIFFFTISPWKWKWKSSWSFLSGKGWKLFLLNFIIYEDLCRHKYLVFSQIRQ